MNTQSDGLQDPGQPGATISADVVGRFRQRLEQHPVYEAVERIQDLRCFMQHHVYSVWDFMSLIKHLQAVVAPTRVPWVPGADPDVQRDLEALAELQEALPILARRMPDLAVDGAIEWKPSTTAIWGLSTVAISAIARLSGLCSGLA